MFCHTIFTYTSLYIFRIAASRCDIRIWIEYRQQINLNSHSQRAKNEHWAQRITQFRIINRISCIEYGDQAWKDWYAQKLAFHQRPAPPNYLYVGTQVGRSVKINESLETSNRSIMHFTICINNNDIIILITNHSENNNRNYTFGCLSALAYSNLSRLLVCSVCMVFSLNNRIQTFA